MWARSVGCPRHQTMNATLRTLAVVALVVLGAFAGSAVAASDASLSASPASPGEASTHTATLTVGDDSAGSLNGFRLDYSDAGMNVSNVGVEDVVTVGIDRDDDSSGDTVDVDVSDDLDAVQHSNNGGTLTLKFGGSYSLNTSDEVVVVVENVQNPDAGDYAVTLDINPQSSGGEADATLSISEDTATSTATATDTEAVTDSPTESTESTEPTQTTTTEADDSGGNEMDATQTTSASDTSADGPGFGVALTVLALLGAAFVAVRQRN